MVIRRARNEEFDAVRAFYHAVIDDMAHAQYRPGWEKDIYPAPDYLQAAIARGELFLGEEAGQTVAAMVLNTACNDSYADARWLTEAAPDEALVIHTLCVRADRTGRGLGREMVRFAIEEARRRGMKAMRLDVLKGNVPAERLYPACGFRYVGTIPMFYEDTGWTDYELYELALKNTCAGSEDSL